MKISDFLDPAEAIIDVRVQSKQQLLQTLAQKAAASLGLQADDIVSALVKREELGSTGLGHGVAIPHARLPVTRRPFGMIARLKPPVDFNAIDARPADLVFMLLLPAPPGNDHLAALALVARKLKSAETLTRLRQAKSPSELYTAVTEG